MFFYLFCVRCFQKENERLMIGKICKMHFTIKKGICINKINKYMWITEN